MHRCKPVPYYNFLIEMTLLSNPVERTITFLGNRIEGKTKQSNSINRN
jgi:hypothetical protein